jgi:hypothetical protein
LSADVPSSEYCIVVPENVMSPFTFTKKPVRVISPSSIAQVVRAREPAGSTEPTDAFHGIDTPLSAFAVSNWPSMRHEPRCGITVVASSRTLTRKPVRVESAPWYQTPFTSRSPSSPRVTVPSRSALRASVTPRTLATTLPAVSVPRKPIANAGVASSTQSNWKHGPLVPTRGTVVVVVAVTAPRPIGPIAPPPPHRRC